MSDIISQMGGLAEAFLSKHSAKLRKSFKTLFIETLILYVVMQKTNFTQLGTFGTGNEKTYRSHFEKGGIDTVRFNLEMARQYFEGSIGRLWPSIPAISARRASIRQDWAISGPA